MKLTKWFPAFFLLMPFFSDIVQATDFRAKVGSGKMNYELTLDGNSIDTTAMNPLSLNGTFIFSPERYFDISYSSSSAVDGDDNFFQQVKRSDIALTMIHRFGQDNDGSFVYGYRQGETSGDIPSVAPSVTEAELNSKGLFLGLGYSWRLGGGAFTLSGAVAAMQGEWIYRGNSEDADTTYGATYGMSYSFGFNNTWGMVIEAKSQKYQFDFSDDSSLEESLSLIMLSFTAKF